MTDLVTALVLLFLRAWVVMLLIPVVVPSWTPGYLTTLAAVVVVDALISRPSPS